MKKLLIILFFAFIVEFINAQPYRRVINPLTGKFDLVLADAAVTSASVSNVQKKSIPYRLTDTTLRGDSTKMFYNGTVWGFGDSRSGAVSSTNSLYLIKSPTNTGNLVLDIKGSTNTSVFQVSDNGKVGINSQFNSTYSLIVSGNSYIGGGLTITSSLSPNNIICNKYIGNPSTDINFFTHSANSIIFGNGGNTYNLTNEYGRFNSSGNLNLLFNLQTPGINFNSNGGLIRYTAASTVSPANVTGIEGQDALAGTNITGGGITFTTGRSTGNASSDIKFLTSGGGSSGSSYRTSTEKMVITGAGKVGIGQTTPTAYLHLPASTTAASTAPVKIAKGVLMTSPEIGAIERDSKNLYVTDDTTKRQTLIQAAYGELWFGDWAGSGSMQSASVGTWHSMYFNDTLRTGQLKYTLSDTINKRLKILSGGDGIYAVNFSGSISLNNQSTNLAVFKNGLLQKKSIHGIASTYSDNQPFSKTIILSLNTNDYIEVKLYNVVNGALSSPIISDFNLTITRISR